MTGESALDFFESACRAYRQAERAAGGAIERRYAIAGRTLRLCFAGSALVPAVAPALEHLAQPGAAPDADLTVYLWDSRSTATPIPDCPWDWRVQAARADLRFVENGRVRAAVSVVSGALTMLDGVSRRALYWIPDAGGVPIHERGAPLRAALHWWMEAYGCRLVHAAAVGYGRDAVLLAGKGGSGKSTAALAALTGGWHYLGDDYCLVAAQGEPRVYSLYNSAKLERAHLENFPALRSAVRCGSEPCGGKVLLDLHRFRPASLTATLPLRAVLLPRVAGRPETAAIPCTAAEALRALAPSSLLQLPGAGRSGLSAMAELAGKIPCYRLELGTELPAIPKVMREVLSR
jgi:hypothetical protein